jgi:hypothetical protein
MVLRNVLPLLFGLAIGHLVAAPTAFAAGVGATCGGLGGPSCDTGLWCDLAAGQCGTRDAQGTCVKVPEICTESFIPVCGCDNKTYGNDCKRQAAKVQKSRDGECEKK